MPYLHLSPSISIYLHLSPSISISALTRTCCTHPRWTNLYVFSFFPFFSFFSSGTDTGTGTSTDTGTGTDSTDTDTSTGISGTNCSERTWTATAARPYSWSTALIGLKICAALFLVYFFFACTNFCLAMRAYRSKITPEHPFLLFQYATGLKDEHEE